MEYVEYLHFRNGKVEGFITKTIQSTYFLVKKCFAKNCMCWNWAEKILVACSILSTIKNDLLMKLSWQKNVKHVRRYLKKKKGRLMKRKKKGAWWIVTRPKIGRSTYYVIWLADLLPIPFFPSLECFYK